MPCPRGGVLAQPAAPSGPSLVVPARRAPAALSLDGARPSCSRPPMPRHVTRSARHLRVDLPAGIGRGVDGGGMGGGGSWCPGDGAENALWVLRGRNVTALRFERPNGRSFSLGRRRRCPPAPGRIALLEGPVLGLSGAIDEEPADQPGARTEPGVPADRAKNGAAAGARTG